MRSSPAPRRLTLALAVGVGRRNKSLLVDDFVNQVSRPETVMSSSGPMAHDAGDSFEVLARRRVRSGSRRSP